MVEVCRSLVQGAGSRGDRVFRKMHCEKPFRGQLASEPTSLPRDEYGRRAVTDGFWFTLFSASAVCRKSLAGRLSLPGAGARFSPGSASKLEFSGVQNKAVEMPARGRDGVTQYLAPLLLSSAAGNCPFLLRRKRKDASKCQWELSMGTVPFGVAWEFPCCQGSGPWGRKPALLALAAGI